MRWGDFAELLALEVEEGSMGQGTQMALKVGKIMETNSPLEHPEWNTALSTLLTLRIIINLLYFEPLNLWQSVLTALEN